MNSPLRVHADLFCVHEGLSTPLAVSLLTCPCLVSVLTSHAAKHGKTHEIKRANDTDGVIEPYEAERFIDSIEWLHEVMAERAEKLREQLKKAGVIAED